LLLNFAFKSKTQRKFSPLAGAHHPAIASVC
jgi:hypothetical protein